VSAVLLQKRIRDDVNIHWCLTPVRLSATPRCAAYQLSNQHKVYCCSGRPWTASIFPSFDTLQLLSILFTNLSRLVLLNILCRNPRSSRQSEIRDADFRQVAPLYVINLMNLKSADMFEQDGVELDVCQDRVNWLRRLKTWVVKRSDFIFGPSCANVTNFNTEDQPLDSILRHIRLLQDFTVQRNYRYRNNTRDESWYVYNTQRMSRVGFIRKLQWREIFSRKNIYLNKTTPYRLHRNRQWRSSQPSLKLVTCVTNSYT